ncbi:DUF2384 domain-containing protein [Xinfangfangia sp. D13-10-4-6]|uniref:MbcA/ParS/Xre antitoxin family protein n=1 Tax=Pseudogemmobacter hezensis TaxID=2737662 RepID=UPI001553934A|nr:MbcA/ParS/Xre antitoxin family protein [Pseudogemmobacter hezensis]NPD15957.1 DUF2384 domain-containing protein [Pseudogemmobacter hezensis]
MLAFPAFAMEIPDRSQVLTRAALRSAERLGLTARQFARVIGLSEPSVSRLKKGMAGIEEGSKAWELSALLVRLFRALDAITGGDEAVARAWMVADNLALGGIPAEKITSVQGLVDVCTYLDTRRARL